MAEEATPYPEGYEPHGWFRRKLNYARIVASNPFAFGGLVFGASAAFLNGSFAQNALQTAAAGGFALGAATDPVQGVADQLIDYRRRHHSNPKYRGSPVTSEREQLSQHQPRGILEGFAKSSVPWGQLAFLSACTAAVAGNLATGNVQGAIGVGVFAAGHIGFSIAHYRQQRAENQQARAVLGDKPTAAARGSQEAISDAEAQKRRQERSETFKDKPVRGFLDRLYHEAKLFGMAASDPRTAGTVLFGTAMAVLNFGPTTPGGVAAGLAVAGAVRQAYIDNRDRMNAYRRAHGLAEDKVPPAPNNAVGRVAWAAWYGASGQIAQAGSLGIVSANAFATGNPVLGVGLAGFGAAMSMFSMGSTLAQERRATAHASEQEAVAATAMVAPTRGMVARRDQPSVRDRTAGEAPVAAPVSLAALRTTGGTARA